MQFDATDLRRQFEAAAREARDLTGELTPGQLQWRPAGKWSIAECLDHLNNAERILPRFDKKLAEARAAGGERRWPYRAGWIAGLYIRSVEPPVRRLRFRSPEAFRPKPEAELFDAVPRFLRLQEDLSRRVEESEGVDVSRVRMSSPVVRRFKMSMAEWFAFLAAHQRRHLWQARNVRNHPDFPKPRDGGQ
ncbi:MAG: DinB family protein [Thermoanaerobaculia bacterium]|nr:DinB family protein [Thermoanaerobaculia bacterium]